MEFIGHLCIIRMCIERQGEKVTAQIRTPAITGGRIMQVYLPASP